MAISGIIKMKPRANITETCPEAFRGYLNQLLIILYSIASYIMLWPHQSQTLATARGIPSFPFAEEE